MRTIPATLRAKLLDRFKAEGLNNEPRLRLIAKQTTGHTLLTEPIHEDIPAGFGDVAFRQLEGESEPSIAFAVCIDNGNASVYQRQLPSDLDSPWTERWRYGAATDAAIEFNGTWTLDVTKEWYFLKTDEYPYLFTVESGELYAQHWTDASTRTHLASGVSNISVCRGWQSSDDPLIDQGLIVGYIRSGRVYYRALCFQEDESLFWETEREVTELGTNNISLSVIRTNDFRVGFITEVGNGADMRLVLTGRSYAGQSVRPETVLAEVIGRPSIKIKAIDYLTAYAKDESLRFSPTDGDFYVGNFMTEQTCAPVSSERTSDMSFRITFDHRLLKRKPFEEFLSVTPDTGGSTSSITATAEVDGYDLIVTTSQPMSPYQTINVQLLSFSRLCFWGVNAAPFPVPDFTYALEPSVYCRADHETVLAGIRQPSLVLKAIDYLENEYEERGTIAYTVSVTNLKATQVGDVPV